MSKKKTSSKKNFHHLKMQFYEDERIMVIFKLVIPSIVTILALFGNGFTIAIFMSKEFRTQSMNRWLSLLAISDTLLILMIWPLNNPEALMVYTSLNCKMLIYATMCFLLLSSTFIAIASIDRYIAVIYPTKLLIRKKLWFQLVVLLASIVIVLSLNSPYVAFYDLSSYNGTQFCQFSDPFMIVSLNIGLAFLAIIFPAIIMLITSVGIIMKVNSSKKKFAKQNNNKNSKERHLTRTLIGTHIFFILFNSPVNIGAIFTDNNIAHGIDVALNLFIWYVLMALLLLHCSCAFFLYLLSNKLFRKKFFMMIGLKTKTKAKNLNVTSTITTVLA